MIKYLFLTILIFSSSISLANSKYNQLFTRQELLHYTYKDRYLELTDVNKREALQTWFRFFAKEKSNIYIHDRTMRQSEDIILGKDYRQLLYYFTVTGQSKKATETLGLYLLSSHTLLENFISNPQNKIWNPNLVKHITRFIEDFDYYSIEEAESCYYERIKADHGFNIWHSDKMSLALKMCIAYSTELDYMNSLLKRIFLQHDYHGAPFPISFTGYVGGNSIDILSSVPMDAHDITNLGSQLNLSLTKIHEHSGKLYSEMSIEDFKKFMTSPTAAVTNFFTKDEGFKKVNEHNTFQYGIYSETIKSIRNAKESVFIDMFWMGGTIGINLAQELFKKVNENPDFSVFIITDSENKFQYAPELDFVYNYMRAFSEKFTDKKFYIMPANIGLKRTALPDFFDLLITDNVINDAHNNKGLRSILEKDGFHLLAKSDHTKVFVIDGKNPNTGIAYVGSKNWTDSSGGMNFDEVAKIEGPATAVILNSFYFDTTEAFLKNHNDGAPLLLDHLSAKFPNINWNKESKIEKGVQLLLKDIDIIDRYSFNEFSPYEVDLPYVERGDSIIAPSQNNIYGTEMSAIEQNIQTILGAKKQILIDDQFLYDPTVVEALKSAKLKNNVDIFILLETLKPLDKTDNTAAHIPNNLFIDELSQLGMIVKWKITPPDMAKSILDETEKYRDGDKKPVVLSTTFHVKSISVDGVLKKDDLSCKSTPEINSSDATPVLITGSANKDVMTMSGGFREYQVAVYDAKAVSQHDCLFWERWNDDNQSVLTNGLDDFEIPEHLKELKITDKKAFLSVLRMFFFAPYEFTKDYFN